MFAHLQVQEVEQLTSLAREDSMPKAHIQLYMQQHRGLVCKKEQKCCHRRWAGCPSCRVQSSGEAQARCSAQRVRCRTRGLADKGHPCLWWCARGVPTLVYGQMLFKAPSIY